MLNRKYIIHKQKQLEKKRQREAELEAKKEADRIAKMEALLREQEEIAARKKLLLEQQETERLRQKNIQRKEKLEEERWDKQLNILVAQIRERARKNDKLKEIRAIIENREPSLQKLDWATWLDDPLNQRLVELDIEQAMEMFKRDNLMAEAYRHEDWDPTEKPSSGGGRRKIKAEVNYGLSFTGDTNTDTRRGDLVATDFQPHNYDGAESSIGADGFTISFWIRPDEIVTDGFAIGWKSGAHDRFEFGMKDADQVFFGVASNELKSTWKDMNDAVVGENANDGFTATEMNEMFDGGTDWKTDGTWYHIAVSYVGHAGASAGDRYRRVYLNGRQLRGEGVGPAANDGDFNWDPGNRKILDKGLSFGMRAVKGSGTTVSYNNGLACGLDEVVIYKGVKDSDFIRNVYNGGTNYNHAGTSNLIAYWKFSEGSGTRLEDFGPYGYHGLLTNDSHGDDGGDSGGWVSGTPTWIKVPKGYNQ